MVFSALQTGIRATRNELVSLLLSRNFVASSQSKIQKHFRMLAKCGTGEDFCDQRGRNVEKSKVSAVDEIGVELPPLETFLFPSTDASSKRPTVQAVDLTHIGSTPAVEPMGSLPANSRDPFPPVVWETSACRNCFSQATCKFRILNYHSLGLSF